MFRRHCAEWLVKLAAWRTVRDDAIWLQHVLALPRELYLQLSEAHELVSTIALVQFDRIDEHYAAELQKLRSSSALEHANGVKLYFVDCLRRDLWEREAPLRLIEKNNAADVRIRRGPVIVLRGGEDGITKMEKEQQDNFKFLALFLDLSCAHEFKKLHGDPAELYAFAESLLVRKIDIRALDDADDAVAEAVIVAPDHDVNISELRGTATPWVIPSFATLNARLKAKYIEKRLRDPADSDEVHNMMTTALINEHVPGYSRAAGAAAPARPRSLSLMARIREEFSSQWKMYVQQWCIVRASEKHSLYGDPLGKASLKRRTMWYDGPLRELWLLREVALDVTGAPVTSIDNERVHSVHRNSISRLRQRVTPVNEEYYTLIPIWAKADGAEISAPHEVAFEEEEEDSFVPTDIDLK